MKGSLQRRSARPKHPVRHASARGPAAAIAILVLAVAVGAGQGVTTTGGLSTVQGNPAFEYLTFLSDRIGPRLAGSAQDEIARSWAMETMGSIGLSNVRDEVWMLPRGWSRIHARAEILAPSRQFVTVTSMGWAGSTPPGGIEAEVIAVDRNDLDAEIAANAGRWRGRVLFLSPRPPDADPFAPFEAMPRLLDAAEAAGALAVLDGSGTPDTLGMNLPHTTMADLSGRFVELPVAVLAGEHRLLFERLLDSGTTVRMHLDIQNRVTIGPVTSGNVIGEIPGSDTADEIVVIGAHLDSWDLGQGTTDDGFGVASVLGAAKSIIDSGRMPRRTLRFVLFGGEEVGLVGSLDYVARYRDALDRHRATVMTDQGGGRVVGVQTSGRRDLVAALERGVRSFEAGQSLQVSDHVMILGDSYPFMTRGIPSLDLSQNPLRNGFLHHTAADTLDKVDPETLRDATDILAGLGLWLADPGEWAPPRASGRVVLNTLERNGMVRFATTFGLWPVGE